MVADIVDQVPPCSYKVILNPQLYVLIIEDDISDAYKTLRKLILEYLGMNVNSSDASLRSGTPERHSIGSGSGKQGSRPGTGNKMYAKMQNANEENPKGAVVSITKYITNSKTNEIFRPFSTLEIHQLLLYSSALKF